VRDLASGRIHITSQNHGYAVNGEGLPDGVEVSHVHLNDGTCEGLMGTRDPFLTIQYHSEAAPGPLDNMYIFEQFVKLLSDAKK
jgi:carbamoyl-phosphate synthase small subunit